MTGQERDVDWFTQLTGFSEHRVDDVAAQFRLGDTTITSLANGRTMVHGRFATPSLGELRSSTALDPSAGRLRLREVVADVQQLHVDPSNAGALFQVASQFNTLEMIGPVVTPEDGITRYATDRTQGPACAVVCAAGTIFRNYLVPIGGRIGQSVRTQINTVEALTTRLGVAIDVRNGYALPTAEQLRAASSAIASIEDRDELLSHVRIGVQAGTEVTLHGAGHRVTQAYCSAMPIAYARHRLDQWEPIARVVLDAAYEATLHAAVVNAAATGVDKVFLTSLGGGAFGNPEEWIVSAMARALRRFVDRPLDVAIVSYREPRPCWRPLLAELG